MHGRGRGRVAVAGWPWPGGRGRVAVAVAGAMGEVAVAMAVAGRVVGIAGWSAGRGRWSGVSLVAGCPCQPYSMLSSTRRMLGDANASQLWAVLANIRDTRPMVSNLQVM